MSALRISLLLVSWAALSVASCRDASKRGAPPAQSSSAVLSPLPPASSSAPQSAPASSEWTPPQQAAVEEVPVPGDLSAFVVRGRPGGQRIAFLHGLCGNPQAYAWSFRNAAARLGTLVAVQGNKACSGPFRDWSSKPDDVDARIEAAFRAAGDSGELKDLIIVGYSSGGTYAELLVMKRPERYSRAVLIATPRKPALFRLKKVRGAVLMAGERDRHDLMKEGLRELQGAAIPARFMVLPGATHGEMGPDAEKVMGAALAWLIQQPE